MDNNKEKNQIGIEITDEVAGGVYSNFAVIGHSNSEFVVDFAQIMPGNPKARVKSRVILSPQHAKRLFKALADNINKYEAMFGPIKDVNDRMTFNVGNGTAGEA